MTAALTCSSYEETFQLSAGQRREEEEDTSFCLTNKDNKTVNN